jgi:hypothetical protein
MELDPAAEAVAVYDEAGTVTGVARRHDRTDHTKKMVTA